jgi:PAS domain S-box-containing protein
MSQPKLLIVENELIVAEDLKDTLVEFGYVIVDIITTGEKALNLVSNTELDLILMDIMLKGKVDGINAASIIQNNYDIPVVYLTAHTDDNTFNRAKLTKPYGYIIKPYERKALYTTIELALYNHKRDKELIEKEKRLRESEKRYKTLFETIPQGIIECDTKAVITFINEGTTRIFGFEPEELLGKEIYGLIDNHGLKNEFYRRFKYYTLKQPSPQHFVLKNITKSGKSIYVQVNWNYKRNDNGELIGYIALINDITEKLNSEKIIKEERDKAQKYLDIAEVILLTTDTEGNITMINRKGCEILGFREEDIIGKNLYNDFIPEEIRGKMRDSFNMKLSMESSVYELENSYIYDKTGNKKIIDWKSTILKDHNNEPIGLLISGQDITKLAKTQTILRNSEKKYRAIFERSPIGIFRFDSNGYITHFNDAFINAFSTGKKTYSGFNIINMINNPEMKEAAEQCLEGKESTFEGYYKSVVTKKSAILKAMFNPIIDEDGEIHGGICICEDITERKHSEDELKQSEDKYRSLFTNMINGFAYNKIIVDNNNKPVDYIILKVNRAFERIMEGEKKDFIGKKALVDFAHIVNTQEKNWINVFGDVALKGEEVRFEQFIRPLNKWLSIYAYSLKDGFFATIVEDITARIQAEEKLKSLLKEKETLLKEVHHRVKNNLQVIASLLSIQSLHINDEKIKQIFKESQNRIKSMSIIHEKLYSSETSEKINLGDYIENLIDSLFYSYGKYGKINREILVGNLFLDVGLAIPCGLIITELVSNSLKYAFPDNKGNIKIEFFKGEAKHQQDNMDIKLNDKEYLYSLIISDDGIGLEEDLNINNLNSLGLKIAKSLVEERLKGSFSIDSDKGTKFTIKFMQNI